MKSFHKYNFYNLVAGRIRPNSSYIDEATYSQQHFLYKILMDSRQQYPIPDQKNQIPTPEVTRRSMLVYPRSQALISQLSRSWVIGGNQEKIHLTKSTSSILPHSGSVTHKGDYSARARLHFANSRWQYTTISLYLTKQSHVAAGEGRFVQSLQQITLVLLSVDRPYQPPTSHPDPSSGPEHPHQLHEPNFTGVGRNRRRT